MSHRNEILTSVVLTLAAASKQAELDENLTPTGQEERSSQYIESAAAVLQSMHETGLLSEGIREQLRNNPDFRAIEQDGRVQELLAPRNLSTERPVTSRRER